jgi:hypothetical protein
MRVELHNQIIKVSQIRMGYLSLHFSFKILKDAFFNNIESPLKLRKQVNI